MGSGLINVRLGPERLRNARALPEQRITLSDVVHEAIDQRFQQSCAQPRPDARTLIETLCEARDEKHRVAVKHLASMGAILRKLFSPPVPWPAAAASCAAGAAQCSAGPARRRTGLLIRS